jgi:3-hydroxyacyl-[acyl-carrier-protein] dehydratase
LDVNREYIEKSIPHRPPFLFLDEVVRTDNKSILCSFTVPVEDELFSRVYRGHYPDFPLVPGVLLCEMMFQAAGVLIAGRNGGGFSKTHGTPLLTRIRNAQFKRMVRPGEQVEIRASIEEELVNACYMKGSVTVHGELAARAEFACILTTAGE